MCTTFRKMTRRTEGKRSEDTMRFMAIADTMGGSSIMVKKLTRLRRKAMSDEKYSTKGEKKSKGP